MPIWKHRKMVSKRSHLPRIGTTLPQLPASSVSKDLLLVLLLLLLLEVIPLLTVRIVVLLPRGRGLRLPALRVEAHRFRLHCPHGRHWKIEWLVEPGSGHWRGWLAFWAVVLCGSL